MRKFVVSVASICLAYTDSCWPNLLMRCSIERLGEPHMLVVGKAATPRSLKELRVEE